MFTRTLFLVLLLSGIALCNVRAHDPGLSSAIVTVFDRDIDAVITFNQSDLEALPDFARAQPKQIAAGLLRVRIGDVMLPIASAERESAAPNNAIFKIRWTRSGSGVLRISSGLIEQLPFGHRQLISVRAADGASLGERLLSARENESAFEIRSAVAVQPRAGFAEFFFLGVRHILTGYDHLLFLFGILIVCSGFGAAARIITCFTIAHSITLALATFNVVAISSRVVEPMIAASIVYVGVENLWRKGRLRWREALTFTFGLIHGLGFASALREMGIGTTAVGVALPLFSFNLGVEAGQLAVAACILPVALRLKTVRYFSRIAVPAFSLVIALAGAYWLVERIAA
jgi:hydrogenase/urease accessory protein HupE